MATKTEKSLYLNTALPETRRQLYEAIRTLPEGCYAVSVTRTRWRVGAGQRGYYWGYLIVEVGKLIDLDRDQTDKILNALFLTQSVFIAGQTVSVVRSLSDLDPAAATDYFEQIHRWVWETFEVWLSEPTAASKES